MLVRVDSREIKALFDDIKPIFRNSEESRVMAFTVDNNILYVTVDNGMIYQKEMYTKGDGFITSTVIYEDLSELVDSKGSCDITITTQGVEIESDTFSANLMEAQSIVTRYKSIEEPFKQLPTGEFVDAVKKLSSTGIVAKTYGKESSLVFDGFYATIFYSTVYVRARARTFQSTMSIRDAGCVARLAPSKYKESDTVIEFHANNMLAVIPKGDVPRLNSFDSIKQELQPCGTMLTSGVSNKLQKMLRSVGPGNAVFSVTDGGLEVQVMRNTMSAKQHIGDPKGKRFTFNAPIEFMLMACGLANNLPLELRSGGGRLCMSNQGIDILMSVRS